MNSNRTRYASTPTYGMQKRGLMKKPAPARQVPEAPDFYKTPDLPNGAPYPQQQAPVQPNVFLQQQAYMPQQGYPTMPGAAPMQNAPVMPAAQVPFAMPSFVQPTGQMPPSPGPLSQRMALPLGNVQQAPVPMTPAQAPAAQTQPFSARAQGFVPPVQTAPQPLVQPAAAYQPPQPMGFTPAPAQTIPPFSGMQQPAASQPPFGFQNVPAQNIPPQSMQFGMPPQQQSPVFTAPTAAPKAPREPMDADKLWTLFLFGVLPLLFIPCLFVSGIWNVLRYLFIAATVVGLGGMWYRQMYTPTLRLVISMVYVALCIGSIALLMQGTNDVQRTSAPMNQTQTAATQQQPAGNEALVTVTDTTPEPQLTPTPPPVSGPSAAERRLELFMNLWMVNNTTEMVQLVQPSWCSAQENASMSLFMVLANRTPEDFTIESISGTETDNSRTITMRATINKNTGKAPSVYRFMIMMVKEGDEWYVNPNSLATNDQQAAATDENVVKTQSSGSVTEPPRTTVTPPPPASTLLYYNLGGNNYHMDPNCPSVNADNLPFDMSFSYGDLKAVKSENNLVPCLRCDAPTNTLD